MRYEGGDSSPLLSTGKVIPGILYPILNSLVQERHGHKKESPIKGRKGDEGTKASLPCQKTERAGTACPREE